MTMMCSFCAVVTFAIWVPFRSDPTLIVYAVLYGQLLFAHVAFVRS